MGDHADSELSGKADDDFLVTQFGSKFDCRAARAAEIEAHDIGAHPAGKKRDALDSCQPIRKSLGIFVVAGQFLGPLFERNKTRRRQHTGLPHSAAQ